MIVRSAATARWVLPVPGSPISSSPGYGPSREIADEILDRQQHVGEFAARDGVLRTGHDEIFERGVLVQRRNLRAILQPLGAALRHGSRRARRR